MSLLTKLAPGFLALSLFSFQPPPAAKPKAAPAAQGPAAWKTALPVTASVEQGTRSQGFGTNRYDVRTYNLKLEIRNSSAGPLVAGGDMFLFETSRTAEGIEPKDLLEVQGGGFNRSPVETYAGVIEIRQGKPPAIPFGDLSGDDTYGVYNWQADAGRNRRMGNMLMFTVSGDGDDPPVEYGSAPAGRTLTIETELQLMVSLAPKFLDDVHIVSPELRVRDRGSETILRYFLTLTRSKGTKESKENVTWRIAQSEILIMDPRSLMPLLAESNPLWKRVLAAHWTARYARKESAPVLLAAVQAKGKENDRMRAAALAGLALVKDPSIAPQLLPIAGDSSEYPDVRSAAITTLGELKNPAALESLLNIAEGRGVSRNSREAIEAVGRLGDKSAVPRLMALLEKGGDTGKAAGTALGRLGDNSHLESLAALLKKAPSYRSEPIIEAIGGIGTPEAASLLAELASAGSPEHRKAALKVLGKNNAPVALGALVKALDDADVNIRREAMDGIAALDSPDRTAALKNALKSAHAGVRMKAVSALGERKAEGAQALILPALKDADKDVREAAATALAAIGDKSSVPAIAELVGDKESMVRYNAVRALAKLGGTEAIAPLREALKDEDGSIRQTAIGGLEKIPGAAATEALKIAAEDKDKWVRERALKALGKRGQPAAAKPPAAAQKK